jgi:hypothetical protein
MGTTTVSVDPASAATRTCIDITDLATDRVEAYLRDASGPAHLERRGARTFLVVGRA